MQTHFTTHHLSNCTAFHPAIIPTFIKANNLSHSISYDKPHVTTTSESDNPAFE
jgi:hypothetical protein